MFLWISLLLFPVTLHAETAQPLAFTRGEMVLMMQSPKHETYAKGVLFQVDVREFGNVFTPGWFEFADFGDDRGLLLTQGIPKSVTITPVNHFAKLDILFLDEYGKIVGILPNQALGELTEKVVMDTPVLAVLYLKGGTVDALGAVPGDSVKYKLFKIKPVLRTIDNTPPPAKILTPEEAQQKKEREIDEVLKRHHQK